MEEVFLEQLDRTERNAKLAAKSVLDTDDVSVLVSYCVCVGIM